MVNQEYRKALDRDTLEQFRGKPNLEVLHDALARQLQEVYECFAQLNDQRDLYTAIGAQLTGIGEIAVLTRKEAGLLAGNPIPFDVIDDETYRQYLIWKVLKNTTGCTYPDIIKAFRMFWDKPLYYTEDPAEPATMIFDTGWITDKDADTTPLFRTPLLRAGGVTLKLYARTLREMPPAPLHIRSGLGLAVTVTEIRNVEPEYSFESVVHVRTGFVRETIDSIDNVNPDLQFSSQLGMHSGLQRITHDTMPTVDLKPEFASDIGIQGCYARISQDVMQVVQPEPEFRSQVGSRGSFERVTQDTLPKQEPTPQFSFKLKLGDGFQRISQDTVPRCEMGMTFASTAKVGSAVYSIMETPIRSKNPKSLTKTEEKEHG